MTTHAVTANTSGHDRVGHIAGYGAITARLGKRPSVCTSVKVQFLKLVRALSGYRFLCTGPLQIPKAVLVQHETESHNNENSLLLAARRKSVFGIPLSVEELTELSSSPGYKAAQRWIAGRTGGYGQVLPAPPKANAANTR